MKLAICGPGGHGGGDNGGCGKGTAAAVLKDSTPLRYVGGTSFCARFIVFKELRRLGIQYPNVAACYSDRRNHRELWAEIIRDYVRDDPPKRYGHWLIDQDILEGIRRRDELLACKEAGLFDLVIWIERPGCDDPTCEVTADDCDVSILNTGTLSEFYLRVERFGEFLLSSQRGAMNYGSGS